MRRLVLMAAGGALVGVGAAWFVPQEAPQDAPVKKAAAAKASPAERARKPVQARRFIFFAVLEGCFYEGLTDEDVANVLRQDAKGQFIHFVPGCPLCNPALDAFRLYQRRLPLTANYKTEPADRFRHGMSGELVKKLREGTLKPRLDAVHTLLSKWIDRRLDQIRFADGEREALEDHIRNMAKKGNAMLRVWAKRGEAGAYAKQKVCAVCEGCRAGTRD